MVSQTTKMRKVVLLLFSLFLVTFAITPEEIKYVHVVFSSHLDIGYTGYAIDVVDRYFNSFFPLAIETANQARIKAPGQGYIYLTQAWMVALYLDCPLESEFPTPPTRTLNCPTPAQITAFKEAAARGDIVWHAFPHNSEPELMDSSLFTYGVNLARGLNTLLGMNKTIVMSQRDVPGMTAGVVDPLREAGVQAITVGVNGGSSPPKVPTAFVWKPKGAKQDIMAMWHPGGYGGIEVSDCVMVDGLEHTLATPWRGDDAGPQTIDEVLSVYATLEKEFPNAKVFASTFDRFATELMTVRNTLPVVTQEIGDTWIYGPPSDPWKVIAFREVQRQRTACIASNQCLDSDVRFQKFNRLLVKVPEHTWGLDTKPYLDWENWSNEDFRKVVNSVNYQKMVTSWIEQRNYVDYAIKVLGTHPLAASINKVLAELKPKIPSLSDYTKVTDFVGKIYDCAQYSIGFSGTGSIQYLLDHSNNRQWASANDPLGQFVYSTYDYADYTTFIKEYVSCPSCAWVYKDFGKFNLTSAAVHKSWNPSATALYTKQTATEYSFVIPMTMDSETYTLYGAPREVYITITIPNVKTNGSVSIDLQWFNKTSTRLPEAIWYSFEPIVSDSNAWTIDKMGLAVNPLDIVSDGGAMHLHGHLNGINYSSSRDGKFSITAPDTPVVSVGTRDPFPTPFTLPDTLGGMHFLLQNTLWGTNYVMWYPYLPDDDGSIRFRYQLF